MKVHRRKLVTIGNSEGFTIPVEDRALLDKEKLYDLVISESEVSE